MISVPTFTFPKTTLCRFVSLVVLVAGLFTSVAASAEAISPVLVVDMNRVFQDSISGKAALANFDQERKKRSQIVGKMEDDLRKLDEAIQKQSTILSATAIAEKRGQFEKKRAEFASAAQQAQGDLMKYQQAEFGKVLKQIDDIIKGLAAEKKGRFVLDYDKRVVLFARDGIDMTSDVIEALDENSMKS